MKKILSHAVKPSLVFHGFINFSFTISQGSPEIKKKNISVQTVVLVGGGEVEGQTLPIILFQQRRKIPTSESKAVS
jgi:hypothetical protein